jgi:hypothetical protein
LVINDFADVKKSNLRMENRYVQKLCGNCLEKQVPGRLRREGYNRTLLRKNSIYIGKGMYCICGA